MTPAELELWIGEHRAGTVFAQRGGGPALTYGDAWRSARNAVPLSVSLPLTRAIHGGPVVRHVLEALLPDDPTLRAQWAAQAGVASDDILGLLGAVGGDLAGAVQLWPTGTPKPRAGVTWLTPKEFHAHIAATRGSVGGHPGGTFGWFSLPGAQRKTALQWDGRRWGIPHGRVATTHILKPEPRDWPGLARLEHFTLRISAHLGLPTVASRTLAAPDGDVFVTTRYDRHGAPPHRVTRLHQEDACQLLGRNPNDRYETQGGPTGADIVDGLQNASRSPAEDVEAFFRLRAAQWVLANTDGHARNTSVLHFPGGVRLAPAYDLVSVLPYVASGQIAGRGPKLAMSIGGEFLSDAVHGRHWMEEGRQCGLPRGRVLEWVDDILVKTPAAVGAALAELDTGQLVTRDLKRAAKLAVMRASSFRGALAR